MSRPLHVLILEDRLSDLELVLYELRRAGFDPKWEHVDNEADFRKHLSPALDIVLADFALPQWDGLKALDVIHRGDLDVPLIIVSGTIGEDVAVECMKRGAADYLIKDRLSRLGMAVEKAIEDRRLRVEKRMAEQELRWLKEFHESIVQGVQEGITQSDADGRIVFVNAALTAQLGYRREDLLGKPWQRLVAPDQHAIVDEMNKRRREGLSDRYELTLVHQDGTPRIMLVSGQPRYEKGNFAGAMAVFTDITERKKTEQALERSEARNRALLDAIPDIIFRVDRQGTLQDFKTASLGEPIPSGQYLNRTIFEMLPSDLAAQALEMLTQAFTTREVQSFDFQLPFQNEINDYEARVVISDDNEAVIIVRNMTNLRRTERALRQRTEELSLLYDAGKLLSHTLDLESIHETIYEVIKRVMPCDGFFVSSYFSEDNLIRCVYARHDNARLNSAEFPPIPLQPEGTGTQSLAIRSGESMKITDYQSYLRTSQVVYHVGAQGIIEDSPPEAADVTRSALIVPLRYQERVTGVLQVFSYQTDAFTDNDLHLLQALAPQVAIAAANADLYRQAQQEIVERKQAEEALRDNQRLLQAILDNSPALIFLKDLLGRYLFINCRFEEVFQLKREQLEGKTDYDLFPKSTADSFRENDLAAQTAGTVVAIEEVIPLSDGPHTYLTLKFPLRDSSGAIYAICGISTDITERKRIENAEREQRALAETLTDTASILTSTLDFNVVLNRILQSVGQVVPHEAANIMLIEGDRLRMVAHNGYAAELQPTLDQYNIAITAIPQIADILSSRMPMIVPDTQADPLWETILPALEVRSFICVPIQAHGQVIGLLNLESHTLNFFTVHRAERLRVFADQAAIAIENAQLYEQMLHHAAELEERVNQRTADLNQALQRAEAIFNHSSDGVILADTNSIIQQTNRAFNTIFGYRTEEVHNSSLVELLQPEGSGTLQTALRGVLDDSQVRRIELVARRKEGKTFDVEVGLSTVPSPDQRPAAVICSIRDITERKRAERALHEALNQERELSDLKTRFISMASHEFRTPLAVIQSSADLLKHYRDRMSDSQIADRLANIHYQIKHMVNLLDDVLTVGRSQAGKTDFDPAPLDLNRFCQTVIEEFRRMDGVTHSLIYTCSQGDRPVDIVADQKLLRQITGNLISNAIKYSAAGSTIQFDLEYDQVNVVLRVTDSGIGIPVEDQKYMFSAFHRAANVGSISGSGLGLTIMKNAVDLHHGTISFESKLDHGTTFTVTLPAVPPEK